MNKNTSKFLMVIFALTTSFLYGEVPNPSECTATLPADLNFDCAVDFNDLVILGQQWLECTRTDDPNCQSYIEPAMSL